MKKAIIIPSNTDLNRGDQALVWESIRLVEDVYDKNVECVLMADLDSRDSKMQNRQTMLLGYRFINILLGHPGRKFKTRNADSKSYSAVTIIQWGCQAVFDYCRTRLTLSRKNRIRKLGYCLLNSKQKETLKEIESSDAVFVKGGGFLHSYGGITDPYFIYYLSYHIRLSLALGKKVFVLPNSVGPLENKTARKIIKDTLSRCTFVSVREKLSKKCLDDISVHSFLFPDLGFFLKPSVTCFDAYLSNKNVPLDQKKVAITLRPYRFQGSKNPEELYNNYLTGIIKLVEYLVIHGYHVTFMAHTLGPSSHENDSLAIKEVRQNLNSDILSKTSIIEDFELNCRDVEKIYSYYDFLIGTRFHSVIFALNVNTPSIAIAYGGNKGKGIMNVLGNDEYSIDIDKISPSSLLEMFNELESQKDDYITRLQQSRINIDSERMKLVEEIKLCLS